MLKKTTAKLSGNLLISTLLCCILGSFVYIAVASFSASGWLTGLLTFLVAWLLWTLIYSSCWREGEKDNNRVEYKHMEKFMAKGLVAGLLATIPFVIVYILYIVNLHGSYNLAYYLVYIVFNLPYLAYVVAFKANAPMLALLLIPMPVAAWFGYLMGYRGFSFMNRLIYKNKKRNVISKKSFR